MSTATKHVDCEVWIALSWAGHPAPFLGYAFTRRALKAAYTEKFGTDQNDTKAFDAAGYRAVKVRMHQLGRIS